MNLSTFQHLVEFEVHSEAGLFKPVWKSKLQVHPKNGRHSGVRSAGTSIYFLLRQREQLPWHQLHSDECLFFHHGCPVKVHIYHKNQYACKLLGNPLTDPGTSFQVLIPHGAWFASELADKSGYAFYSETVTPGFEFEDWLSPDCSLHETYPEHKDIMKQMSVNNRGSTLDLSVQIQSRQEPVDCSAIESLLNLQPVTPDGLHLINPTWTSELTVVEIDETSGDSPNNTSDPTSQFASSSVYYMMKPGALPTPWRMHQSDELLLFHLGGSVKIHTIDESGQYSCKLLGDSAQTPGASYQVLNHHGNWFRMELEDKTKFAFWSVVLAPGFDPKRVKETNQETILNDFPKLKDVLSTL